MDITGFFKYNVYFFIFFALLCIILPSNNLWPVNRETQPDLSIGISIGGSIQDLSDLESKSGFEASIFFDAGIYPIRKGTLGIYSHLDCLFPNLYFGGGVCPRYKIAFEFVNPIIPRIAPWIGWNFAIGTIKDDTDYDFVFGSGLSLGIDLEFVRNFCFIFHTDLNFIGTVDYHNYLFKFGLGYRFGRKHSVNEQQNTDTENNDLLESDNTSNSENIEVHIEIEVNEIDEEEADSNDNNDMDEL